MAPELQLLVLWIYAALSLRSGREKEINDDPFIGKLGRFCPDVVIAMPINDHFISRSATKAGI